MVVDFEHFIATSNNGLLGNDPSSHVVLTRISRQLTREKQLLVWMIHITLGYRDSYNTLWETPLTKKYTGIEPWDLLVFVAQISLRQEAIEHICGSMTGASRSRSIADIRELLGRNV